MAQILVIRFHHILHHDAPLWCPFLPAPNAVPSFTAEQITSLLGIIPGSLSFLLSFYYNFHCLHCYFIISVVFNNALHVPGIVLSGFHRVSHLKPYRHEVSLIIICVSKVFQWTHSAVEFHVCVTQLARVELGFQHRWLDSGINAFTIVLSCIKVSAWFLWWIPVIVHMSKPIECTKVQWILIYTMNFAWFLCISVASSIKCMTVVGDDYGGGMYQGREISVPSSQFCLNLNLL